MTYRAPVGGCPNPGHADYSSCPAGTLQCWRAPICTREASKRRLDRVILGLRRVAAWLGSTKADDHYDVTVTWERWDGVASLSAHRFRNVADALSYAGQVGMKHRIKRATIRSPRATPRILTWPYIGGAPTLRATCAPKTYSAVLGLRRIAAWLLTPAPRVVEQQARTLRVLAQRDLWTSRATSAVKGLRRIAAWLDYRNFVRQEPPYLFGEEAGPFSLAPGAVNYARAFDRAWLENRLPPWGGWGNDRDD